MTLYEKVIAAFPELVGTEAFSNGTIYLQDDSDGKGAYIREWNYEKPIPKELKSLFRG